MTKRRIAVSAFIAALVVVPVASFLPAAADPSGSISGTVTNAGGDPLQGVCAELWRTVGGGVDQWLTDSTGHYEATGLADGDYKMVFRNCDQADYLEEWFDDKPDFDSATVITIAGGAHVTGIDAVLAIGGSISGRVTDTSGLPIANESVSASGFGTGAGVATDVDGRYRIRGLRPGDWTVQFASGIDYLIEWYDDQRSPNAATPVTVASGQDTDGIDAALTPAGHIEGMVTDDAGAPLTGICIRAYGSNDYWQLWSADGTYRVDGLPADTYYMSFAECDIQPYATEWWDNQPDRASADPVLVSGGAVISGIDAALTPAPPKIGGIAGHVSDTSGAPIASICITVHDASNGNELAWASTDVAGDYTASGLTPGSYKVQFRDCVGPEDALPEWYDDKPTFATANTVTVAPGGTARADAVLVTCSANGDTDRDGLNDCEELAAYGTDPNNPDTDGDLFGDGIEVRGGRCFGVRIRAGSDPADARSTPLPVSPFPGKHGVNGVPPICQFH